MAASLKILVADDADDAREYLTQLLARQGHQVVSACSAAQLVELARVNEPDLVITAATLPDAGGTEASAEVNQLRPTPAILLEGRHDLPALPRAVASEHVMGYLVKPVEAHDLKAAVAVAVARFEQFRQVRKQADDLKQALEDREAIERARAKVMTRLKVGEDEALRRLRKVASDSAVNVVEVARAVLATEEVFRQLESV